MDHFAAQLVSFTKPASFAAEQYQNLRLKIERLRQTRDLRVIAITSPGASDGKTVTSINLAGALARGAASRVLLGSRISCARRTCQCLTRFGRSTPTTSM